MREILFSLIISIPFTIVVDFIGTASNLWVVPSTLFPKVIEILPIEDWIWMISAIFTSIMLGSLAYKFPTSNFLSNRFVLIVGFSYTFLLVFFILYLLNGIGFFVFSTSYLYIILAMIFFGFPAALLAFHYKKGFLGYSFSILYFFVVTIIFESIAVMNSWWQFKGFYFLKPLIIFGNVIPIEELLFVGIIGPIMAMLLYRFLFQEK